MSGWNDLVYVGLRVLPWDGPAPFQAHTWARFDTTFTKTVVLLRRELEMLDASELLVELDISGRDIRQDGYPRANARPVGHPGVRVDFKSKHGPVRMETAEFTTWQDNLRAIALSLEALRKVDRYGVSKRGEQYRGWAALPMSTDAAEAIQTREQAIAYLHSKVADRYDENDVDGAFANEASRLALQRTHPDHGGDPDEFRRVVRARELLNA